MLIKCPECNKEISDKSDVCIHCGFPIKDSKVQNAMCQINNNSYDFSIVLNKIQNKETPGLVIRSIRDICDMSLSDAKKLYDNIIETHTIPKEFNCDNIVKPQNNIPKCPTCGSTNIQKIGTGERVASVAMLGLFSKKINKSYKCLNCKCTW